MEQVGKGILEILFSGLLFVLGFIYKTGWIVENCVLFILRYSLFPVLKFLRKCTPVRVFNWICGVGERVIKVALWLYTHSIRLAVWFAHSFVADFCYWAPLLAVIALVGAGLFFRTHAIALEVRLDGKTVSYVRDEEEFDGAVNKVEGDLAGELGVNYSMYTQPEYRFVVVKKNMLSDEDNLYAQAYRAVTNEIGHHYALYVDGQRVVAVEHRATLEKELEKLKAEALERYNDGKSKDIRIEFISDVEIRSDLLSPSELVDAETLQKMFDGASDPLYYTIQEDDDLLEDVMEKTGLSRKTIKRLNPDLDETRLIPNKTKLLISQPDIYLGVKVVRTVEYDETIEAPMTRVKNNSMYVNATKVKKAGKDGTRHIVKEITEIDGKTESKIISSVVTKEAVAGELYVGTKPYPNSYSSLAGTGAFIRPISGGFTSCPYGGYPGHRGIDLTMGGAYGKPIYASAGGTVISAGWAGGYGYCVKIRHSNGYVTLYAHCSALLVSAGQYVNQGQQIARIGSTGNSTGPHLHFEIIINGTQINPARYI